MADDTVGCIITAIAVIAGGYWVFNTYEIRKREPAQAALAAPPYKPPRPTGMATVSSEDDGTLWRVDADTVRGPRAKRQGWAYVRSSDKNKKLFYESKTLYQADCETTASRTLATMIYDKKGNVLYSESKTPEKATTQYYPPDTRGGAVVDFICGHRFDEARERVAPPIVTVPVAAPAS